MIAALSYVVAAIRNMINHEENSKIIKHLRLHELLAKGMGD